MQAHRLGNLISDPHHGIERGHRLLEDHGDAISANFPHFVFVEIEKVGAFEHNGAADNPARRIGHEAHDRKRGHALAASGLADDGQGLAATNIERNVIDSPEQPRRCEENRLQALHVENHLSD